MLNILLVDDNPDDVYLMRKVLEQSNLPKKLHVVENGSDALRFLQRSEPYEDAPRPKLILLDLLLPDMSGLEVLRAMNHDPALRSIPVIILTVSEAEEDLLAAYDERARAFVPKPRERKEFEKALQRIEHFWLETAQLPTN